MSRASQSLLCVLELEKEKQDGDQVDNLFQSNPGVAQAGEDDTVTCADVFVGARHAAIVGRFMSSRKLRSARMLNDL